MDDKQPEAAHAANEIDEPNHNPYQGPSVVLVVMVLIILGASLLALWLG